ncbi:MAG: LCP family protein [Candidatus Cryosericum sp.]
MRRTQKEPTPLTPANGAAPRIRRTRRIIVSTVLILLVLIVGTGLFYAGCLHETLVTNIKHDELLPTPSASQTAPVNASSAGNQPIQSSLAKGALNVLLIGSDSNTSVANGRSDVIILVHISSDHKKVYLIHFPRDMYVEVPGRGKDKINAAYAYGGSQLLIRTLRGLVDVPIDHAAVIGFEGFKAMTDAVGGVDVYAEEASNDDFYDADTGLDIYYPVHVGMNHLDGKAALAFVRTRYQFSMGDISRGRRQQEFIQALMLRILSKQTLTNPVRFAALVKAIAQNLTVDNGFSIGEIYSEALTLKNLRSEDIVFITAPITGFGRSPQGASIDIVDNAKMAQLSIALRTDTMGTYVAGQ